MADIPNGLWKWFCKWFYWLALLALGFLVVYESRLSIFSDKPTPGDLIILGVFVVLLLVPLFDEIGVLGVSVKRRVAVLEESAEKAESIILRGEVVRNERGNRFYIDDEQIRHLIHDNETAHFLQSQKGEIQVSDQKLASYRPGADMESVRRAKLVQDRHGNIFIILNGKKYYINSHSHLTDWKREDEKPDTVDGERLREYPTGR